LLAQLFIKLLNGLRQGTAEWGLPDCPGTAGYPKIVPGCSNHCDAIDAKQVIVNCDRLYAVDEDLTLRGLSALLLNACFDMKRTSSVSAPPVGCCPHSRWITHIPLVVQ
jgi:hypothetical protein